MRQQVRGRAVRTRVEDQPNPLVLIPGGLFSGLLCLFLVKGFFKSGQKERTVRVEITADDQPLLFDFIDRLCEETGAPTPRKVYVSHEVNAAVMTHTGITSLFWPTGKDLLIGLGLVNILNLSEFKSVLAHEFGHFAQKSTRLGGYVYTADGADFVKFVGSNGPLEIRLDHIISMREEASGRTGE